MKRIQYFKGFYGILIFHSLQLLNVNGTFLLKSFNYRRFVELLSASQFFNDTCLFKFPFELFQRFLNVFAFFYWYYNHFKFKFELNVNCKNPLRDLGDKSTDSFLIYKTFLVKNMRVARTQPDFTLIPPQHSTINYRRRAALGSDVTPGIF